MTSTLGEVIIRSIRQILLALILVYLYLFSSGNEPLQIGNTTKQASLGSISWSALGTTTSRIIHGHFQVGIMGVFFNVHMGVIYAALICFNKNSKIRILTGSH